jgi:hypothetical protein
MSLTLKTLLASVFVFDAGDMGGNMKGEMRADKHEVDAACRRDAEEIGCGDNRVGNGLLRCMQEYKKSHREHRFSRECREAMKRMREEHKEMH